MYRYQKHYLERLHDAIVNYWDSPSLCDFRGRTLTYGDFAVAVEKYHIFMKRAGVEKGQKVALCAKNSAAWGVAFLASNSYETVTVPILADFTPDIVAHLTDHSQSVLLFTDKEIWDKMDKAVMPDLRGAVDVGTFTLLYSADDAVKEAFDGLEAAFADAYPNGYGKEDVVFNYDNDDDLAIINYTSGTTNAPKGVMLPYKAISANIDFGQRYLPTENGCGIVSMLPMAHMYGLAFEFIYPFCNGCCVTFLGKTPSPSLLLSAMKTVKPYLLITVPLVMEKIYKSSIKPKLSTPLMKILTRIPLLNNVIYGKVRDALLGALGGNVREIVMGGAPLNPEVEACFRRIGLPYTVGYGMTEAGPLLAYWGHKEYAAGSCGRGVDCAQVRIDSDDPENKVGEIQARGINICYGYYRNEEATKAAFTEDGWLKTGDLGVIDKQGNVFIKGRSKSMILGANGQNIYPEEVEAVVNNRDYVVESVVVDRDSKLVALVYLDKDAMAKDGADMAQVAASIRSIANKELPAYSQIAKVEVVDEPFAKTPKMSIKRFMYK